MDHHFLSLPATEIATLVRSGRCTAGSVLEAHIARIESVNPGLNALVSSDFEGARERAQEIDTALATGLEVDPEQKPFLGVPFTVKELIEVEGQPNTAGVVARAGIRAKRDAPLVQRLKDAGANLLGVTNVAQAGLWLESHNQVYGRTNNAHSAQRIAGGSSGGEASIIAAGGSAMGIGADIGGSIRNPAFFNGIGGHKPSGGLLPSVGHWPPALGQRGRYCVSGPMGRCVADLEAMMEVFSPDIDRYRDSDRAAFQRMEIEDPSEVTVYYFASNGLTRISAAVRDGMGEAIDAARSAGFRVQAWRPKGMWRSAEIWMSKVARSSSESVRELLGDGKAIDLRAEWQRSLRGKSNHAFYGLLMASLEALGEGSEKRAEVVSEHARALQERIENKLGPRGVLLSPVYPRQAPRHHLPLLSPLAFSYCGIFNVLEFPATALPTRTWPRQLPVGVQVSGARFADPLVLAVARALERQMGGFRAAPPK